MNIQVGLSVIPKRFRMVLIIGINVALFVAAYFFLIDPQLAQKEKMGTELRGLQQELAKVTAVKNNIEKLRKEHAEVKERLEDIIRQMPEEKEVPNLLRQVSFVAGETSTKVKSFTQRCSEQGLSRGWRLRSIHGTLPQCGLLLCRHPKMERIVHVTVSASSREKGAKIVMKAASGEGRTT
jgi:type IV pilus assembly protein PilO